MLPPKLAYCYAAAATVSALVLVIGHVQPIYRVFKEARIYIFGPLWTFDQYCGENELMMRNITKLDLQLQDYFNAKALKPLHSLDDTRALIDSLNQVVHLGIKSRSLLTVVCSINSWGYATERAYKLSNGVDVDRYSCRSTIGQMLRLVDVSDEDNISNQLVEVDSSYLNQTSRVSKLNLWLQLNSFGKPHMNPVLHSNIWLGNYDQCIKLESTRYCYGSYRHKNWPENERSNLEAFRVGLCLPKTCDAQSVRTTSELAKLDKLIKSNLMPSLGLSNQNQYHLVDVHCPPDLDSPWRSPFNGFISKLLIAIAIVWAATTLCATLVRLLFPLGRLAGCFVMDSFDVLKNLRRFWSVSRYGKGSELLGLDAVKVISMLWLMTGHFLVLPSNYTQNLHDMRESNKHSFVGTLILQAQHVVSGFFIISGLIVGHQQLPRLDRLNSIKIIVHRYFRLAPMYLVVYSFVKQFCHLIGSGPLWDHGVSIQSENRQCQLESWFVPILMIANFISPFSHCVLTGWHVANDFQIFLILPLVLYTFKRSRLYGHALCISCFLFSHFYHVWNLYWSTKFSQEQLSFESLIFGPRILLDRLAYDYVNPLGRFGTLLIGISLADCLFLTAKLENKKEILRSRNCNNSTGGDSLKMTQIMGNQEGHNLMPVKEAVGLQMTRAEAALPKTTTYFVEHDGNLKARCNLDLSGNQAQNRGLKDKFLSSVVLKLILKFKDELLTVTAAFLLIFALLSPLLPRSVKLLLGPFDKALSYPTCRIAAETGWVLGLYTIIAAGQREAVKLAKITSQTGNSNGGGGANIAYNDAERDDNKRPAGATNSKGQQQLRHQHQQQQVSNIRTFTSDKCNAKRRCQVQDDNKQALGSKVLRLFNLPVWNILVKLNYCLMLTHFTVARQIILSQSHLTIFSWTSFTQLAIMLILSSYLISFLLHLFVEIPLALLVRQMLL